MGLVGLPIGVTWKLGKRNDRQPTQLWPYQFGPLAGWFYNGGRDRVVPERVIAKS
jgi:hypothetical protein